MATHLGRLAAIERYRSYQSRTSMFFPSATERGNGRMIVVSTIIGTAERVPLPDLVIRAAIQRLCSRTATRLAAHSVSDDAAFAGRMTLRPIAGHRCHQHPA